MTRPGSTRFHRLAALQELATLERRRELEGACAETDRRAVAATALSHELAAAEAGLTEVFARDRLCLDSLRWAAAIVGESERALTEGEAALDRAKGAEQEAGSAWMTARHRTEWFGDQARDLEKKEAAKIDDRAEAEARSLRVAGWRGVAS